MAVLQPEVASRRAAVGALRLREPSPFPSSSLDDRGDPWASSAGQESRDCQDGLAGGKAPQAATDGQAGLTARDGPGVADRPSLGAPTSLLDATSRNSKNLQQSPVERQLGVKPSPGLEEPTHGKRVPGPVVPLPHERTVASFDALVDATHDAVFTAAARVLGDDDRAGDVLAGRLRDAPESRPEVDAVRRPERQGFLVHLASRKALTLRRGEARRGTYEAAAGVERARR